MSSELRQHAQPILLLDDDPTVAQLAQQVLAAANIANPVEHVTSGTAAADRLAASAAGAAAEPVLVILDLTVPDMSGLEVLKGLRAQAGLAHVPVVMLSGSGDDRDIEHAYALGIDAYLVKPSGIYGLPDVLGRIEIPRLLLPRRR